MSDPIENSYGELESTDWHEAAAEILRTALKEMGQLDVLKRMVMKSDFWTYHYGTLGVSLRNLLRSEGYGEREMGIVTLDDHYIPIMLRAIRMQIKGGYSRWNVPHPSQLVSL